METFDGEVVLEKLINQAPIVVIDIFSQYCPPCKQLTPVLEDLEKTLDAKSVRIFKVDVTEEAPQFVRDMGIKMVPTILYYKEGKLILRENGFKTKDALIKSIESL